jgi:hypothetical protein
MALGLMAPQKRVPLEESPCGLEQGKTPTLTLRDSTGSLPREPKGLYHPRFKSLGMRDWPTRQAEVNECKRLITTSIEYNSVSQCCKISPLARKVT